MVRTAAAPRVRSAVALRCSLLYRGLPRGDCAALANALAALSQLAALPEIVEAEINPLIVRREGEGVVAVDGLLLLGSGYGEGMPA